MNIKFYMAPGSCSTGIHILLEELDLVFEAYIVNLPKGEHLNDDYRSINPKSTIPSLVTPQGQAITEYQAIVYWLARNYPKANLLPGTVEDDTRVCEALSYLVGTVHGQGFARIFATEQYTQDPNSHEAIKQRGREIVDQGLAIIDAQLQGKQYLIDSFSIADPTLFYLEFWAEQLSIPLPSNCHRHYHAMLQRPSVQQVLMEEGYHSVLAKAKQSV